MIKAIELIAAERDRQMSDEGWTFEHDNDHTDGELAQAAACYAWPPPQPIEVRKAWPWNREWWKPTIPASGAESTWREIRDARVRDLVKAGALIVAEIERLERIGQ